MTILFTIFARIFGSGLWSRLLDMGGALLALVTAVINALPAIISAVGSFLKVVAESPLLSFLFGATLIAPFAVMYGLSWDAPIRERQVRHAVEATSHRYDVAIVRERKHHDDIVAGLKARIAALEKAPAKGKR